MQILHKAGFAMENDFQKKISSIFDYTYSNTSVRVPSQVGIEVGKILHTGLYREEKEGYTYAFSIDPLDIKDIKSGKPDACNIIAQSIYSSFKKMNDDLKLYDDNIRFDEIQLANIACYLIEIKFSSKERDYFGDALEIFRSTWAKQAGGQFFTDQRVTSLALHLINYNPYNGDDLVDLCAGTGGFLLAGFHKIKDLVQSKNGTEKDIITLGEKSLIGMEIDEDIANVGNSTMSSRLGNKSTTHIFSGNSLDINKIEATKRIFLNHHKCAATNPPFGAKIQVRDYNILSNFELAKLKGSSVEKTHREKESSSRSPDILFIEQNVRILEPGVGRLAIIMPYQLLSGAQATYIRYWLLLHCHLIAVIDLPSETFQPHTGTKTSLVILKRRKEALKDIKLCGSEDVFMATPRWIGHDRRGNPTFTRSPDGTQTNEILTDFPEIERAYDSFTSGKCIKEFTETYSIKSNEIIADPQLRINAMFYKHRNMANTISQTKQESDDWKTVKLGSVVQKIFYPGRFKRSYVDKYDEAVPFLGGSNITSFVNETGKWIRHDDKHINQLRVEAGWVLVTRSGSTGIISIVPPAWDGFAMSEHVIRIIPNKDKISGEYIYAFLKSNLGQLELSKGIFGSVIEEISPDGISEIDILIPKNKKSMMKIENHVRISQEARNTALTSDSQALRALEEFLIK